MKKLFNLLVLLVLIYGLFFVYGKIRPADDGKIAVSYGSKTICSKCGIVMDNNVKTIRVPPAEAQKYHIEVKKGLCPRCGSPGVVPF